MTPTFDMDDPKWTAYVLGELAAAEREELERVLAANAEAREYVASLRETIGAIEAELATQPAPALDDLQRHRIRMAATKPPRRRWAWIAGALAASAAAASIAIFVSKRESATESVASGSAEMLEIDSTRPNLLTRDQLEGKLAFAEKPRQGGPSGYKQWGLGMGDHARLRRTDVDVVGTEAYARIDDNVFHATAEDARSTFSVDVDTASYANVRRFLEQRQRPPKDAVRIEELINYFRYSYPEPDQGEPMTVSTEVAPAPWAPDHQLVRIGLQAPHIADQDVPPRNLVFLIDTSGSMMGANRLPLVVQSLDMLVGTLRPQDRIAIVTYAGSAGLVLAPTADKSDIREALHRLQAGGSTNGGAGIQLAYDTARKAFRTGGINRVILCTDGDFNVGTTSEGDLTRLIEKERETGVFLTVLGYGMGNTKDATMEKLADRGNGNYAYIDGAFEAKKVLVQQAGGTLVTVAKDVKLQIDFNPARVAGFRLIGYENRVLAHRDFNDDKKDAGDMGAGHAVTALYEIVPAGQPVPDAPAVDPHKYQAPSAPAGASDDLLTVKIRYKAPDGATSKLLERSLAASKAVSDVALTTNDFRWAAAIAGFGMMLRESPHRGTMTWAQVQKLAEGAVGPDAEGYRRQALGLIDAASKLPSSP